MILRSRISHIIFLVFSTFKRGDRKRRPAIENSENNRLRIGERGVQDDADVAGGHLRVDGARGDKAFDVLKGERRVELRGAPLGAADRRDTVQGDRHACGGVWGRR